MQKLTLIALTIAAGLAMAPQAHAQKEAMTMFYEIQMAPTFCKWTDAGSTAKIDATISAQETAFGVTAADRATMKAAAETDLKSDPSNCAKDGMLRAMYDSAVK